MRKNVPLSLTQMVIMAMQGDICHCSACSGIFGHFFGFFCPLRLFRPVSAIFLPLFLAIFANLFLLTILHRLKNHVHPRLHHTVHWYVICLGHQRVLKADAMQMLCDAGRCKAKVQVAQTLIHAPPPQEAGQTCSAVPQQFAQLRPCTCSAWQCQLGAFQPEPPRLVCPLSKHLNFTVKMSPPKQVYKPSHPLCSLS